MISYENTLPLPGMLCHKRKRRRADLEEKDGKSGFRMRLSCCHLESVFTQQERQVATSLNWQTALAALKEKEAP